MASLEEFRTELKTRIVEAANAPRWQAPEVEDYMAAFRLRCGQFDVAALNLVDSVVRPRLEALAEGFPSARIKSDTHPHRCSAWFAASDRFPVTAMVEFKVEHDSSAELLYLRYEAFFMPVFHQFQPHDRLTVPLTGLVQVQLADWTEQRILEFVSTYLRYDRGYAERDDDLVTDSVCGMRIRRRDAKVQAKPTAFITLKTM